jgi:putative ABC transport system ATP-binding protein
MTIHTAPTGLAGTADASAPSRSDRDDAIVIAGLNHWFGAGEARKQALFDIDLKIARGQLTILLGASGSGKTTLLTLIGCLRRVEEGSVSLLGTELFEAKEDVLVQCRRRLGFIFQAHNLHESLTAMQNVRMGLEVHGPAATAQWREAASHLLTLLGLGERLD